MQDGAPINAGLFTHKHVRTESRLLIQATCNQCGSSKLVSLIDGSLQQWESTHECKGQAKPGDGDAASAPE